MVTKRVSVFALFLLVFALFVVSSGAVNLSHSIFRVASASTYDLSTLNGASICPASPLSGAWDSKTNTCTVSSFTLNSGDMLDIEANVVLSITGTATIDGTVNNYGTIQVESSGEIDNHGTITTESNSFYDDFGRTVNYQYDYNYGTEKVETTTSVYDNQGTFVNYNYDYNHGTITNEVGATYDNRGRVVNYQYDDNYGTMTTESGARYDNRGSVVNYQYDTNYGTRTTESGSTYDNRGSMVNYQYDYNYGTLTNEMNGVITNYQYDYNYGTITNMHGGSFENSGTIYDGINRYIYDYGTFYNGYSATGTIYNQGTIDDESGASLINGYSGNVGTIYDSCGGIVIETGTYTGNQPVGQSVCQSVPQFPEIGGVAGMLLMFGILMPVLFITIRLIPRRQLSGSN